MQHTSTKMNPLEMTCKNKKITKKAMGWERDREKEREKERILDVPVLLEHFEKNLGLLAF